MNILCQSQNKYETLEDSPELKPFFSRFDFHGKGEGFGVVEKREEQMDQRLDSAKCYREKKAETILWTDRESILRGRATEYNPQGRRRDRCHPLQLSRGGGVAEKEPHGIGRQKAPVKSLFQYLSGSQSIPVPQLLRPGGSRPLGRQLNNVCEIHFQTAPVV